MIFKKIYIYFFKCVITPLVNVFMCVNHNRIYIRGLLRLNQIWLFQWVTLAAMDEVSEGSQMAEDMFDKCLLMGY